MEIKKEVRINTAFDRNHSEPIPNDGPNHVEPGESIPVKTMVEAMLQSGAMLSAKRRFIYEFGPNERVPVGYYDPTREPGFDMIDAHRIQGEIIEKLKEKKAEQAAAAAKKTEDEAYAKRKAEETEREAAKVPLNGDGSGLKDSTRAVKNTGNMESPLAE